MKARSFVDVSRIDGIRHVVIPILQRDYAQGRQGPETEPIRRAFLGALCGAIIDGRALHLDFVYGRVVGEQLEPLDGQQRLTTLFLLHWYVAARAAMDEHTVSALPKLTYETRYSSRQFCDQLVRQRPFPLDEGVTLSEWVCDQRWFTSSWRTDPTIAGMLVVLDDLHALLRDNDPAVLWSRLVDADVPCITFDFLPVEELGLTDDLYIKMNSRGKPLTPFENFKAAFEEMVRDSGSERYEELAQKLDTQWTDLFWGIRSKDNQIDAAFLHYFRFVTDVIAARSNLDPVGNDLQLAGTVYGDDAARLGQLFESFDLWNGQSPPAVFASLFVRDKHEPGKAALFDDVDLFSQCARSYRASTWGRGFALWKMLVLLAVLEHLRTKSADFPRRVRVLRNLLMNSSNSLRDDALPALLAATAEIVATGVLAHRGEFNPRQLAEEKIKKLVISEQPELQPVLERLEDHPLLRGCLVAFDLRAPELAQRAAAFSEVFADPGGLPSAAARRAWLASGDYSSLIGRGRYFFGAQTADGWRDLLTGGDSRTRESLAKLLDAFGARTGTATERLSAITAAYLADCEAKQSLVWRYYMVKYDAMRSESNGQYLTDDGVSCHSRGSSLVRKRRTEAS